MSIREQFEQQGYSVQAGVLDPEVDLKPLREAYARLINELAHIYLEAADVDINPDELGLAEQFCVLVGASHGAALHHLDPALNIFAEGYRWRPDLPESRGPEMFRLLTNPRLLDVVEQLVGPEITASPIYHVNQKPAAKHLELAGQLAKASGVDIAQELFFNFQIGRTGWHMDAIAGLPDSHDSNIVNAWIPMTPATVENGCLMVLPGSHLSGVRYAPHPSDLDAKGVKLPVQPGDVVFLHNRVMHCSVANSSAADFRWAFNFRYLPTGQPTGRPYLPEFVARSRAAPGTELHDPEAWRMKWVRALDHINEHGTPTSFAGIRNLSLEEARELTRRWREFHAV